MIRSKRSGKRVRIIAAAISLFGATHDVRKVSPQSIANEAGVSPATVYNHFRNRDNLMSEVANELVGELMKMTRAVIDSEAPFPGKLSALSLRGEPILAASVGRSDRAVSHLFFSVVGPAVIMIALGATAGMVYSAATNDVAHVFSVLLGAVAPLPAVLVLVGVGGAFTASFLASPRLHAVISDGFKRRFARN